MLIKLFLLYLIIILCLWTKTYFFDEEECDFKQETILYTVLDFLIGYIVLSFLLIPIYFILEVYERIQELRK